MTHDGMASTCDEVCGLMTYNPVVDCLGQFLIMGSQTDAVWCLQDVWHCLQALLLKRTVSAAALEEVLRLMGSIAGRCLAATDGCLRAALRAVTRLLPVPTAAALELLQALACTGAALQIYLLAAAPPPTKLHPRLIPKYDCSYFCEDKKLRYLYSTMK